MTKSDGLRAASKTGDFSSLAQVAGNSDDGSLADLGTLSDRIKDGDYGVDWAKYDPRRLWTDRPKSIRLKPKTIQVQPSETGQDRAALLAAKGLDPAKVTVIRLD
jgi:hypothetical protein